MFMQHYARHLTSCLTRQRSNKGWTAAFLPSSLPHVAAAVVVITHHQHSQHRQQFRFHQPITLP